MKYFYSAAVMGYGNGRSWHKRFNFPNFKRVTQTLTLQPKAGMPFAIIKAGHTVWNRVGLHNIGLERWINEYWLMFGEEQKKNIIVSISGDDWEIELMSYLVGILHSLAGVELNFSCPNVKDNKNTHIPDFNIPIYLKLNHKQDPYKYDLDKVTGIRVNSVPKLLGGISGKAAQKENWAAIERWCKEGLNVAGASCLNMNDILRLEDYGCKEIGIGSSILIKPRFIEELKND